MAATAPNRLPRSRPRLARPGLETVVFLAGAALVALHVADDAFLQPQPGTSISDHLVSGLVPLALLGLVAWRYPHMRGGGRAVAALLVGLFGVAGGVEAVHYARHGGPTGDDFTGLASIPAGLVLMGLGATTLWRTRRRTGHVAWRVTRRALLVVAVYLVAQFVLLPVVYMDVATHVARPPVQHVDLGPRALDVSFRTSDGLRLRGTYVPSRNGAAIIAFPGRKGPQPHARMLIRHGYGVLILDRRGEGESDGDPNPFGWNGDRDIKAAIAFLKTRPDVDPARIGGIGLSVGGELMLETASETPDLRAVVSEGAGSRWTGEDLVRPADGATKWLTTAVQGVAYGATALFSGDAPPPRLQKAARHITVPTFLIYSDKGVDTEDLNPRYYSELAGPKQIWQTGTGHIRAATDRPAEYERRVVAFLDRALAPG
jgi:hypothetical protein